MLESKRRAVAEVILSRREQHVVVRPLGKLLVMTVLQHQNELKEPTGFEDDVEDTVFAKQELQMTRQLVDGMTPKNWSFTNYVDDYQQRLGELIEAKVEGKELVKVPESEAPQIINLMDALKASIEQIPIPKSVIKKATASVTTKAASTAKPARKAAASKPRSSTKRQTTKRKMG